MCVNPIYIKNKAKSRYGGMEYVPVPCRNCPECAAAAQNDYLTRTVALCNSLPENYSFFFCTLTFNNESLPRTNVYSQSSDGWKVIASGVPCFNHQLYKRFRKNFTEFCTDHFGMQCYLLSTCEYGDKKHRPHYHTFCAFPCQVSWRQFKAIIERYWHYGFTKNIAICKVDNSFHTRTPLNCIKYITKYVCKYNIKWLPFYLKDNSLSTDFPPYEISPKTFISNNYGSGLMAHLTTSHYMNNSVFMQLKLDNHDRGKDYSIPQYYRRKYFTFTEILTKERFKPQSVYYPWQRSFSLKSKYRITTLTHRRNGYNDVLFKNFVRTIRTQIFDYMQCIKNNSFVDFLLDGRFSDTSLSPSLLDDCIKVYNENSFNHYRLSKCANFNVKSLNDPYYAHSLLKYAIDRKEKYDLPWCEFSPGTVFYSKRSIPFSFMPEDYAKLQIAQYFLRTCRKRQYALREEKDIEWYKLHHVSKSA